jgi:hypothetical protein
MASSVFNYFFLIIIELFSKISSDSNIGIVWIITRIPVEMSILEQS